MADLYIMGSEAQQQIHLAAIGDCSDVDLLNHDNCEDPLDGAVVDGLVLLDVEDKSYWIAAAVAAGIPVMATHPINRQLQTSDKSFCNFPKLCIMSHGRNSELSRSLANAQNTSPASYFSIELNQDSSTVQLNRQEHLLQASLDLCDLLLSTWGSVDLLYGRMRNFFHLGPSEDVAVAMLSMRNGVEGLLRLIDFPGLSPGIRVRSYAKNELYDQTWACQFSSEDLRSYYRNFVDCIQDQSRPLLQLKQVEESYSLLRWMRKSARSNAILNKRESR